MSDARLEGLDQDAADTRPGLQSEAHYAFLRLWTKAVGTPEYDKKEWSELELLLFRRTVDNG